MFTLGATGFSWEVSGLAQVLKVTRALFLFCLLSYFSFSLNWPAFFLAAHTRRKLLVAREKKPLVPGIRDVESSRCSSEWQICHPLSCTDFVVFPFLEEEVRLFPLCKPCNENFPTFSAATKRLENNWGKATSSSRRFVCRFNFLAVYCWSHLTGYCKRYWRIRNLSQSESVKYGMDTERCYVQKLSLCV